MKTFLFGLDDMLHVYLTNVRGLELTAYGLPLALRDGKPETNLLSEFRAMHN